MAKDNQLKLLYVLEKLYRCSDEEHYVSATELVEYLESKELSANRKSIYGYIDSINEFGMNISKDPDKFGIAIETDKNGSRILDRQFQLAELKLLVDAVHSSRFIPAKKSETIVEKIETLTSENYAKDLDRKVFVENSLKYENKAILNNIDAIHKAINEDRRIKFNYFSFTVDFSYPEKIKKQFRCDDEGNIREYEESPFALIWKNENYYLLSYDTAREKILTFRVDRISNIDISNNKRLGKDVIDKTDINRYSDTAFSMYGGEVRRVEIRVRNDLAGVVFDRFGYNVSLQKSDEGHFSFMAEVQVSPMFFSWISGFGNGMKLLYPSDVVKEYREYMRKIVSMYDE